MIYVLKNLISIYQYRKSTIDELFKYFEEFWLCDFPISVFINCSDELSNLLLGDLFVSAETFECIVD